MQLVRLPTERPKCGIPEKEEVQRAQGALFSSDWLQFFTKV